jgi:hypothetical protein
LPAALYTNGFTLEQCALAAGAQAYEVFAMQSSGYCFMGQRADLVAMKTRLDNSACSTTPCVNGVGCVAMVNKAYRFTARRWPDLLMLQHIDAAIIIMSFFIVLIIRFVYSSWHSGTICCLSVCLYKGIPALGSPS